MGSGQLPREIVDPAERLARLALARSAGIGPVLYFRLLARFGSAREALAALPRLVALGRLPRVRPADLAGAEAELEAAAAHGARVLLHGEPGYPARLGCLEDPPPVLTCLGRAELLDRPAVAIVGARNASANGRSFARRLARELAGSGLVVVSGLARGIDAAAHEGALGTEPSTLAVTACGVDLAYPPENEGLMRRIVEEGLVVSERPMGAEARARHFPRRNRTIAALSLGTVVVEAAERSGSLMTARLAAELGREVMAVPGTPMDPRHRGTNRLLREGTTLVETAADVLDALGPLAAACDVGPGTPRPPARRRHPSPAARQVAAAECREPGEADGPGPEPAGVSELARRVLGHLAPEPVAVDELVRQSGASAADLQQALFELELEGRIVWHPGNRVARTGG